MKYTAPKGFQSPSSLNKFLTNRFTVDYGAVGRADSNLRSKFNSWFGGGNRQTTRGSGGGGWGPDGTSTPPKTTTTPATTTTTPTQTQQFSPDSTWRSSAGGQATTPSHPAGISDELRQSLLTQLGGIGTSLANLKAKTANMTVPEDTSSIEPANAIQDMTPSGWLREQMERDKLEAERRSRERDEALRERKDIAGQQKDFMDSRISLEEKYRAERSAMGVDSMMSDVQRRMADIEESSNRVNRLIEQRDAAIGIMGGQAVSTPFITGQQARIAQAYDSRINAASAHMGTQVAMLQVQQGNIDQAMGMVDRLLDAYTYDTAMELQKFDTFLNHNREEIEFLDGEYKEALFQQRNYWANMYEEERSNKNTALNAMVQHYNAGIDANDTPEQVAIKVAKYLGEQIPEDIKGMMTKYNPQGAGITADDSFEEALRKIAEVYAGMPPEPPKVFGDSKIGYFTQAYDAETGTFGAQQLVRGMGFAPTAGSASAGRLSDTQMKYLMEEHKGAGIVFGDTIEDIQMKLHDDGIRKAGRAFGQDRGFLGIRSYHSEDDALEAWQAKNQGVMIQNNWGYVDEDSGDRTLKFDPIEAEIFKNAWRNESRGIDSFYAMFGGSYKEEVRRDAALERAKKLSNRE